MSRIHYFHRARKYCHMGIAAYDILNYAYNIYYVQKGANGKFPATAEGWLDEAVNAGKKFLITEVGNYTEAVN